MPYFFIPDTILWKQIQIFLKPIDPITDDHCPKHFVFTEFLPKSPKMDTDRAAFIS